jgi:hypothetical protein
MMMADERDDYTIALSGSAYEGCEALYRLFEQNSHDGRFMLLRDQATNCHVKHAAAELTEGKYPVYFGMRASQMRARNG